MRRRLRDQARRLPRVPGVYQWKDEAGSVLYVGKAVDLRSRVTSYLSGGQSAKNTEMLRSAHDVDFIAVRNNKEALLLEQTLIKRLKPRYNVRLTDDKQYPYIKLTNDAYPRLMKVHRYTDDGATYFGPFPDGYGAYHVMQVLNDLFPLRRCKTLPDHKCLYYDIGKCIAPCIDACTDDEYAAVVAEVEGVLRGRSKGLLRRLRDGIREAATDHRFEDAARMRDQLAGLEGVLEKQHMLTDRLEDRDVAALEARGDKAVVALLHQRDGKIVGQSPFVLSGVDADDPSEALAAFLVGHYADRVVPRYVTAALAPDQAEALESDLRTLAERAVTVEAPQRGDKKRWLEVAHTNAALRLEEETLKAARRGMGAVEALQNALGLASPPRAIEGFDISHHSGAHTRAAMVRFVDGDPDKAGYRTFGMKETGVGTQGEGVDDYASLHEAVQRRYRGVLERGEALPDLVLIDGGRGQLAAAREALQGLDLGDLPVVSLAKREEEVHVPGRMHPLRLDRSDAGLQLLQRVRDEAHRFGITQVRRKAGRGVAAGPLERVPGIGPKRRAALVQAFGGLEGLKAATEDDLVQHPGVTRDMAQAIVAALAGA